MGARCSIAACLCATLLLAPASTSGGQARPADSAVVEAPVTSSLLFDKDMTVGAGATVAATAAEALATLEDAVIPHRLLAERGAGRRAANIAYRFAKLIYFDLPQEQWIAVANHEVFGHGGRLRELFDGPIRYRVDAPVPYGDGGGATSFRFDRQPTVVDLLTIATGGMEANAAAAALVVGRAVERQRMSPRDAMRYLAFELDALGYVLGTADEPEDPGHDVFEFLQTYNSAGTSGNTPPLAARTLRREALAGLANPMIAYSLYGIGRYVWTGRTDVAIPMLRIGGVRYLPLLRYRLTPTGREFAVVNQLAGAVSPTRIELRVGRWHGARPWAIGVENQQLHTMKGWTLGVTGQVWRQPPVSGPSAGLADAPVGWGGALLGRAERPVVPAWFGTGRATIILELGAKSAGFAPGHPLRAGLVGRAGVGLPLNR